MLTDTVTHGGRGRGGNIDFTLSHRSLLYTTPTHTSPSDAGPYRYTATSVTKCYHGICVALNPQSLRACHRIFLGKSLEQGAIPCVLVTVISEHVVHLRLILAEALQAVVLRHHLVLMSGH